MQTPSEVSQTTLAAHGLPQIIRKKSLNRNWRKFADYSVDELFPTSPFDRSSCYCGNCFFTEESAKFDQFTLKIYTFVNAKWA